MKNDKALILAVDDEHTICDLIRYSLEPAGISVVTAENGKMALTVLEQENVDLIITDLLMPAMTGLEFIKEMKKRKNDTPIIIITAYGNMEMSKEILKEGVYKLMEKPLDFDVLVPIVKEALKERGVAI